MTQSPLAQIVYVSRAMKIFSADELTALAELSSARNRLRDVSGALLSCCGDFMQLLEGELSTIAELYEKIRQDPRHTDVRSLVMKNVERRLYSEWGMSHLNVDRDRRLDRNRLASLVKGIRETNDTARYSVEARVLLSDFRRQMMPIAA